VPKVGCETLSGTTNYLYDGLNLLEEADQSGSVLARYTQDDGIDNFLAILRSGTTTYFHADALGSVTSLSNPARVTRQNLYLRLLRKADRFHWHAHQSVAVHGPRVRLGNRAE